jgi:hypothetical protein
MTDRQPLRVAGYAPQSDDVHYIEFDGINGGPPFYYNADIGLVSSRDQATRYATQEATEAAIEALARHLGLECSKVLDV